MLKLVSFTQKIMLHVCSKVLVDLSDDEGGEEGGASKPKKEEPEDLGIPNVAVGSFPFARFQNSKQIQEPWVIPNVASLILHSWRLQGRLAQVNDLHI